MKKKIIGYLNGRRESKSNLEEIFALFPDSSESDILSEIEDLKDKGLVNFSKENQTVELATIKVPALKGVEIPVCCTETQTVDWGYKAKDRQLYVSKNEEGEFDVYLHFHADEKKMQISDEILPIDEFFKDVSVPSITLVSQLDSNGDFKSMRIFRGTVVDSATEDSEKTRETEKNIAELVKLGFGEKLEDVDFKLDALSKDETIEETSYVCKMEIEEHMCAYIYETYGVKRNMNNKIIPERRKSDEDILNNLKNKLRKK